VVISLGYGRARSPAPKLAISVDFQAVCSIQTLRIMRR
jgi:hypothetical protein